MTQSGLFENAKQAKNAMENAQTKENAILEGYANEINAFVSNNRDEVEKSGSKINNLLDNSIEIPLKTNHTALFLQDIFQNQPITFSPVFLIQKEVFRMYFL